MPESQVRNFGHEIVYEDWSFLLPHMGTSEMVAGFENYTNNMIKANFPEKIITISNFDKPFMTQELKELRRKRQRIYRKRGGALNTLK